VKGVIVLLIGILGLLIIAPGFVFEVVVIVTAFVKGS